VSHSPASNRPASRELRRGNRSLPGRSRCVDALDGEIVAGRRVREPEKTAPLAVDGSPTPSRARGMASSNRREGDRRGSVVGRGARFERKQFGAIPRPRQTRHLPEITSVSKLWKQAVCNNPEAAARRPFPQDAPARGVVQLWSSVCCDQTCAIGSDMNATNRSPGKTKLDDASRQERLEGNGLWPGGFWLLQTPAPQFETDVISGGAGLGVPRIAP